MRLTRARFFSSCYVSVSGLLALASLISFHQPPDIPNVGNQGAHAIEATSPNGTPQLRTAEALLPPNKAAAKPPHSQAALAERRSAPPRLVESYGRLPLAFERNEGQTDSPVKFLSRGRGYTMFLTGDEAVLSLSAGSQKANGKGQKAKVEDRDLWRQPSRTQSVGLARDDGLLATGAFFAPLIQNPKSQIQNLPVPSPEPAAPAILRMRLVGANSKSKVAGLDELPGKNNYFIGNDPKKWRTNVPTYVKVRYENVYPGVDLVYYGNQGQLEYDFVVAPGADPKAITLAVAAVSSPPSGAQTVPLQIDANGDLVIATDAGEVRLHKPVVYQLASLNPKSQIQNRKFLDGRYTLVAKNQVAFDVASYDANLPLVIDPVLEYSTYLGGSANDAGEGFAVDGSGNSYITGVTPSIDFPTVNPLQATLAGSMDAFVAKVNAAGSGLVYSTYVGGSTNDQGLGNETGLAMAVDGSGNAYVTGWTSAPDFPTMKAIQPDYRGGNGDAFVFKLNTTGSALEYSTYLGGRGFDAGTGLAVDGCGDAYVTGYTASDDFPTANALQANFMGGWDAFVTKLVFSDSTLSLAYSTYLGGSGRDIGNGIAVDSPDNNAYIAGSTDSSDFPLASPIQSSLAGGEDAFVAKLNARGSALAYSTYLGGSALDQSFRIVVDSTGNAYVIGLTVSSDFPTTPGSFQTAFAGGCGLGNCGDAFVTKLDADGSALVFSTYLGGATGLDQGSGIALDSAGNVYVTGFTNSTDFPTVRPIQAAFAGGCFDAFVVELEPGGSALLFSSYLGGTGCDQGAGGIAVDSAGMVYVGGVSSIYFPVTPGAFQTTFGGGEIDAFVAKIAPHAYAAQVQPPISSDGLSVFSAKRGVVPVKFTLSVDGSPTCDLPPAMISLFRTSGSSPGPVDQSVFLMPSDSGSNFRIDTTNCQYVYNLGTSSLGAGTYVVNISIGGSVVGSGIFGLQ